MQKKDDKNVSGTGSLTGSSLEADDVLAGSEPWDPVETKLVLWSFAIAAIALIIGLFLVPTSIIH